MDITHWLCGLLPNQSITSKWRQRRKWSTCSHGRRTSILHFCTLHWTLKYGNMCSAAELHEGNQERVLYRPCEWNYLLYPWPSAHISPTTNWFGQLWMTFKNLTKGKCASRRIDCLLAKRDSVLGRLPFLLHAWKPLLQIWYFPNCLDQSGCSELKFLQLRLACTPVGQQSGALVILAHCAPTTVENANPAIHS